MEELDDAQLKAEIDDIMRRVDGIMENVERLADRSQARSCAMDGFPEEN